jgi:hypothetical protein
MKKLEVPNVLAQNTGETYIQWQSIYANKHINMSTNVKYVRFEVLMVATMQMAVFWVVAPCSLVEVYQCFRGACCLHHQGNE